MKRVLIILLLTYIVLITWCWKNNWITKSEVFENNIRCQWFLEEYKQHRIQQAPSAIVEEPKIFYSPKTNSCLWYYADLDMDDWFEFTKWWRVSYCIEDIFDIEKTSCYIQWYKFDYTKVKPYCYGQEECLEEIPIMKYYSYFKGDSERNEEELDNDRDKPMKMWQEEIERLKNN